MFRHRFDPSSVVAAVLFLGIAARYLDHGFGGKPITYLWAIPAIAGGLFVLGALRLMFRSRRRSP